MHRNVLVSKKCTAITAHFTRVQYVIIWFTNSFSQTIIALPWLQWYEQKLKPYYTVWNRPWLMFCIVAFSFTFTSNYGTVNLLENIGGTATCYSLCSLYRYTLLYRLVWLKTSILTFSYTLQNELFESLLQSLNILAVSFYF